MSRFDPLAYEHEEAGKLSSWRGERENDVQETLSKDIFTPSSHARVIKIFSSPCNVRFT